MHSRLATFNHEHVNSQYKKINKIVLTKWILMYAFAFKYFGMQSSTLVKISVLT